LPLTSAVENSIAVRVEVLAQLLVAADCVWMCVQLARNIEEGLQPLTYSGLLKVSMIN
jgi:hypothetical protein